MKAPVFVPKGQNMNSRGCQPTEKRGHTFDPAGVALFPDIPPWFNTHGYSCLAASRLITNGGSQ